VCRRALSLLMNLRDTIEMRFAARSTIGGAETCDGRRNSFSSGYPLRHAAFVLIPMLLDPKQPHGTVKQKIVHMPLRLPDLCSRQPLVARNPRRNPTPGAADITVEP
jgi:hypothetical protein